jgi:transposase
VTDFQQDHPDGVILTMDEMSLYLQATLMRVWYPTGQRPTVLVSPQRDCLHWYGALALHSGQEVALNLPTMDSHATLHFLTHLLTVFPLQPILLFLDRAPWHRGQAIRTFLAQHPRLQLIYFPPACPQLNPQEHVWKATRQAVGHNHHRLSLASLRQDCARFLDLTLFHFRWVEKFAPLILCHV